MTGLVGKMGTIILRIWDANLFCQRQGGGGVGAGVADGRRAGDSTCLSAKIYQAMEVEKILVGEKNLDTNHH